MSPRTIMMPALQEARSLSQLRRVLLCASAAWQLLGGTPLAIAQQPASNIHAGAGADTTKKSGTAVADTTKKTATAAADSSKPLTPDQLDALVAPIALYPDDLLAQTLAASTYPLEIVQLQQWLAKNPKLKDKALADSVAKQPWDPSVQSMAALPDLVKRLGDDIQWTTELGNAFLAQQSEVMAACQRMRKKAKDKGTLETNEQQKVETKTVEKTEVIVIQPQNPEVVYVPSYSPTVVYGPPVYAYPPIYYPYYPPGAAFISFGVGMMWGAAMWGGACCHAGWGGNNIYINYSNNFNRVNHNNINNINRGNNVGGGNRGGNNWSHNPQHRGGAPYADSRTANKYGGQRGAGANNRAGAGVSDRSAGAGGQRAGASDRSAGAGQANRGASASDRSAGGGGLSGGAGAGAGGGRSGGSDAIGNRSIPRDAGGGGFGGGSGYSGSNARASSSRGSSSMGSRGGGGMSRGGGGGGRRR